MLSLLFLIPIALVITGIIIWAFIWAIRSGQYEDLERAGREVLYDESTNIKPEHAKSEKAKPELSNTQSQEPDLDR